MPLQVYETASSFSAPRDLRLLSTGYLLHGYTLRWEVFGIIKTLDLFMLNQARKS